MHGEGMGSAIKLQPGGWGGGFGAVHERPEGADQKNKIQNNKTIIWTPARPHKKSYTPNYH